MLKKENTKSYFVMDENIKSKEYDNFNHVDIANNITSIIKNDKYKTPYNITLIAKWGVGKSGIINIIEEDLEREKTLAKESKYKVTIINVWRHENL